MKRCASFIRRRYRTNGPTCFWTASVCACAGPAAGSGCTLLVAYGVRQDGTRQLLSFMRSQGESQTAWEGLLEDLYRRGLKGNNLLLTITYGRPGLAAAIETVYPRALYQR